MFVNLVIAVASAFKKFPPWLFCVLLTWIAIELMGLKKSIQSMELDISVIKVQLDDHVKYAHFMPPPAVPRKVQ